MLNLTRPQKYLLAGQLDAALAALPAPDASSDPRVEIIRARIRAEDGQLAAAIATLDSLQLNFPHYAPSHLYRGIFLWDTAQPSEALQAFATVMELQQHNTLAVSYHALCLLALGEPAAAASQWRRNGFSDNAMFRVRVAEFVETAWLTERRFFPDEPSPLVVTDQRPSQRKALRCFYRRDFKGMLAHVPPPPTENELMAFLAGTAHEMLGQYSAAKAYVDPFMLRRSEWPDPLVALNARLLVRLGDISTAAREFATILLMGPEDFGVNYYMGIICLAYERPIPARQYFNKAFTSYMVDTLEFQWWQIEQALLLPVDEGASTPPHGSSAFSE